MKDCPQGYGAICFKCGDNSHTSSELVTLNGTLFFVVFVHLIFPFVWFRCYIKEEVYMFADCFICKQPGHLTRQCPKNETGLYPKGGACFSCGSKLHLSRNCDNKRHSKKDQTKLKQDNEVVADVFDPLMSADAEYGHITNRNMKKVVKV